MPYYHWKGTDGSQDLEGDLEAANEDDAAAQLQQKGIIPTELMSLGGKETAAEPPKEEEQPSVPTSTPSPLAASNPAAPDPTPEDEEPLEINFRPKKVKNKELVVFTKKLATMVNAGLPILKTLEMLRAQSETPNFQKVVHHIYKGVESGRTLSEAFMQFPTVFDTVYINLLRAGETSGKLTTFLFKLVIQIEKAEAIRKKVKKALMYPIILTCVAVAVIALMMVKVVPIFADMFDSMGGALPGPTQLIVDFSNFLRDPAKGGTIAFAAIFGIISLKYTLKKSINFKRKFDGMMLKLPVIKNVIKTSTLAKIAMIQGNLSAAGVSVLDSLDIIARSMSGEPYRDTFIDIKQGVAEGKTMSALYAAHEHLYPPTFSQMLSVGEETGNMDGMFESTALYFEEEFDSAVDAMTEMLEPIMIVFMGLTVGFIIVAMYMPIFQMGQMVSGGE